MGPTAGYGDADLYHDKLDGSTSWPDGLHEECRFQPHLPRAVRRFDSTDNIERFKVHYSLVQKKRGSFITWRQYLNILLEDLRHFDVHVPKRKMPLRNSNSPVHSDTSNYITASESDTCKEKAPGKTPKRKIIFRREIGGDTESISSTDTASVTNSAPATPQQGILKKVVSEIRRLAENTCKSVDRMTANSGRRAGESVSNGHKKCHQLFVGVINIDEPLTPSMLRRTKLAGGKSMSFDSPMKAANGSGEFSVNPHSPKLTVSRAIKRMKPFIKISPKEGELNTNWRTLKF